MPLSFVYWGLIVVAAAGLLLLSWVSKEDLLVKALTFVIWEALIGLQILAMRLPFRIAAGLPLPWYRTAVYVLWCVCLSLQLWRWDAAAVHLSSFVLSAPQTSSDADNVLVLVMIAGWGVCLVWGLWQLRGDPTHAPLRMHRRLALLSVLVGAVDGIVLLMNTLFPRRQPDFLSEKPFEVFIGTRLRPFLIARTAAIDLLPAADTPGRACRAEIGEESSSCPDPLDDQLFQRRYPQAHIPGQPNCFPSARHVEPRAAEVISEPDSISQDAAPIPQTGTLSSVGRTLMGAQRMVLQAILNAQGETTSYVFDTKIAEATQIAIKDVRDWLETLEG